MRHPRTSQPTLQVFTEQLEIDRLRNAGVAAGLQNALPFGHHGGGRHGDYRDIAQRRLLAQPRGKAQTIIGAELTIQQPHMGMLFLHRLESCLQVRSSHDFVAFGIQPLAEQFAVQRVIFHDQDAGLHTVSEALWTMTRRIWSSRVCCQGCSLRRRSSACPRRRISSSRVRSLLVRMKTGRSAVRGLARPSASSSEPLIPRSSKTPITKKSTRLNSSHGYISYALFCF